MTACYNASLFLDAALAVTLHNIHESSLFNKEEFCFLGCLPVYSTEAPKNAGATEIRFAGESLKCIKLALTMVCRQSENLVHLHLTYLQRARSSWARPACPSSWEICRPNKHLRKNENHARCIYSLAISWQG